MGRSGNYSIQVLYKALSSFGLSLVHLKSEALVAKQATKEPEKQQGYICHMEDHWFALRKINNQWFNLDSMLKAPLPLSDLHIGVYISGLQGAGYTILVIVGTFPKPFEGAGMENMTPIGHKKRPSPDGERISFKRNTTNSESRGQTAITDHFKTPYSKGEITGQTLSGRNVRRPAYLSTVTEQPRNNYGRTKRKSPSKSPSKSLRPHGPPTKRYRDAVRVD